MEAELKSKADEAEKSTWLSLPEFSESMFSLEDFSSGTSNWLEGQTIN